MQAHGLSRYKLLAYRYDLISGKVNEVHYQPGERDGLYHRYEYDGENRITDVFTTFKKEFIGQKNLEDHEAFYQYYKHGPLAKTILGHQQVQGLDYAYTLQGWLKGVNLDSTLEDAITARDAYSFSLHYFGGDYTAINTLQTPTLVNAAGNTGFKPLYNGNIGAMAVNIKKLDKPLVYNYGYDQLNRLVSMDAFNGWDPAGNIFAPNKLQDYKERVSYDANGNILTYERNGQGSSSGLLMDKLVYQYERSTAGRLSSNRLRYVLDEVQGNSYAGDLKTGTALSRPQVLGDNSGAQGSDNYGYDAIGNLIKDVKEGITSITWTVYGKIESITKANGVTIAYTYDAGGNRISKTVTKDAVATTTWYVRDAQGNVMSIYTVKSNVLTLSEQHLYGSSRLGIWNRNVNMDESIGTPVNASGIGAVNTSLFDRGNKVYELSNHLGNVLVTVSDKKRGVPLVSNSSLIDYYTADVTTAQDYYPFGMLMPGRRGATGTNGTWTATGSSSNTLPANPGYSSRTGNTPAEYKATQSIEFLPGFEGGENDAFEAFITTESSENGGTGTGVALGGSGYRYGFNGKENDNEVEGEGNQQDYGMRIYDPRLGKFLSVDPLTKSFPWYTPYQFAGNKPISAIDLDGAEEKPVNPGTQEGQTQSTFKTVYPSSGAAGGADANPEGSTTSITWNWHAGGLKTGKYQKGGDGKTAEVSTQAGWYNSEDYTNVLSTSTAARQLASNAGYSRFANPPQNGQGNLDNFIGTGLNENAANHLNAGAWKLASKANFSSSGYISTSSLNVEDLLGVGLLVKGGLKLVCIYAAKNILSKVPQKLISSEIWIKVGHWCTPGNYNLMKTTGKVIEEQGGFTFFSINGSGSWAAAPKGWVYSEFDVPANSLMTAGKWDWWKAVHPNAGKGYKNIIVNQGGSLAPPIRNLTSILETK